MTEKHTESGTKLITGHKRDGRCIYSKQGKRELAQACSRPGVSVAGMGLRYGVNANLLRKWIRAYPVDGKSKLPMAPSSKPDTPRLLPVIQVEQTVSARRGDDAPMNVVADHCIEIVVAAFTVRLRGAVDSQQLSTVLDCLARDR
jgi:transposase-like protein